MEKYFGFAKELMDKGLAKECSFYEDNKNYDHTIEMTEDIPFYLSLAKVNPGKVLDIGCGTGRVMAPLLKEGIETVGMDLSEDMLTIAKSKLLKLHSDPRLVQGDMKDFEIPGPFSLIIIPNFSMIYIHSDTDRKRVFKCIYKHLAPGGKLAFDFDASVETPETSKPWLSLQHVDHLSGEITIQTAQRKVSSKNQRLMNIISYTYKKVETLITAESVLESTCSAVHMKSILEQEGFVVEGLYSNYQHRPYDTGEVCVVVAKKA